MKYDIHWLARLFCKDALFKSVQIDHDRFVLTTDSSKKIESSLLVVSDIGLNKGTFWSLISLSLHNGEIIEIGGIKNSLADSMLTQFKNTIQQYQFDFTTKLLPSLKHAASNAKTILSTGKFIREQQSHNWLSKYRHLKAIGDFKLNSFLNDEQQNNFDCVQPILTSGTLFFKNRNDVFLEHELAKFKDYFDSVESKPLTRKQREACVINEQNNLVIAGAGTGKTSTMIGRAGYLIESGQASADQILMIAYGNEAAKEMAQRIKKRLGYDDITVKTFHSLGKDIIAKVEQRSPSIHKMAEDNFLRTKFIDDQFKHLIATSSAYKEKLLDYFVNHSYPYKSVFQFKSLGEYFVYIKEQEIRTLNGELVKSLEECEIANFLYRQGIHYEYEANYKVNTYGPDFRMYQPDFYLPEYDIYIEHFALDENNNTPPFINKQKYLTEREWKIALHNKHDTQLIQTFSYQKRKGILLKELEASLTKADVKFAPIPNDKLLSRLNEIGIVSKFSQLLSELLTLFKASLAKVADVIKEIKDQQAKIAFELFSPIYDAYQAELKKADCIDFDDMIAKAINYIQSGQYQSPFSHILVDEFQDISHSRANLVKSLIAQNDQTTLFCVGDDWQSIYRFTGSDISLTKNFSEHFGHTATSFLDTTFRFNNKIGEASAKFIMKNPEQLEKNIESIHQVNQPAISLITTINDHETELTPILRHIADDTHHNTSVMIIIRFKHLRPSLSSLKRQFPSLNISVMTAHASKGKEADFVIILGLDKGKFGFPSEKATHPLLDILLPESEEFKHAEERRLFYVALTRARHHVYLVTDSDKPSLFIRELIKDKYDLLHPKPHGFNLQKTIANVECPKCQNGYLIKRKGIHGDFTACSNYPLCKHTQSGCEWCGDSLKTRGRFRVCENNNCDYVQPICPKCDGSMKQRSGRYGKFWGCSHYNSSSQFSCSHKEQYIDLSQAKP